MTKDGERCGLLGAGLDRHLEVVPGLDRHGRRVDAALLELVVVAVQVVKADGVGDAVDVALGIGPGVERTINSRGLQGIHGRVAKRRQGVGVDRCQLAKADDSRRLRRDDREDVGGRARGQGARDLVFVTTLTDRRDAGVVLLTGRSHAPR